MRPEAYERVANLAQDKDVTVGEALDKIVIAALGENGDVVANQVNAKVDWSEKEP